MPNSDLAPHLKQLIAYLETYGLKGLSTADFIQLQEALDELAGEGVIDVGEE